MVSNNASNKYFTIYVPFHLQFFTNKFKKMQPIELWNACKSNKLEKIREGIEEGVDITFDVGFGSEFKYKIMN